MQFVNTPNSGGAHLGSAYDAGYEGYLLKTLEQLRGQIVTAGSARPSPVDLVRQRTEQLRRGDRQGAGEGLHGAGHGQRRVDRRRVVDALPGAAAAKQTMPVFDAIQFRALGVVGQPAIDWQNRPTFQQVVSFPRHRAR